MRLLKLELLNLNALYGQHSIDFESDLQQAPLFLISGPTGSGKSTLLDAISLALFGVTPRLRDEGPRENQADQKPEHVLSRGTAQGKAVLTFRKSSPGQGCVTYRATWEVWLGNKRNPKVGGNLQGPYRWLERHTGGEPQWSTLATDYQGRGMDLKAAMSEALEGFSLPDFTRCMLLAQGDFAAFLQASEAERGAILERLTQTETYKQIGARAAQRLRDAKAACERVEAEIGTLKVLPEAEIATLEQTLAEQDAAAQVAQARAYEARDRLQWLDHTLRLASAADEANAEQMQAEADMAAAKPDLARLAAFEDAKPALTQLEATRRHRENAASLESRLSAQKIEVESQTGNVSVAQTVEDEAVRAWTSAKQALLEKEPELERARLLRASRDAAAREAAQAQRKLSTSHASLGEVQAQLDASVAALRTTTEVAHKAQQALEAAPWATLVDALPSLEAQYRTWEERSARHHADAHAQQGLVSRTTVLAQAVQQARQAQADSATSLAALQTEDEIRHHALAALLQGASQPHEARQVLDSRREELTRRRAALDGLSKKLDDAAHALALVTQHEASAEAEAQTATVARQDALLAEASLATFEARVEELRRRLELMAWARDVAKERDRLSEGTACPLCGAVSHPALVDPQQGLKDKKVQAECERLEASLSLAQVELSHARPRAKAATRAKERAEVVASNAHHQAEQSAAAATTWRETVLQAALAVQVAPDPAPVAAAAASVEVLLHEVEASRAALDQALDQAQKASKTVADAQRVVDERVADARQAETRLEEHQKRLAEEERRLDSAQEAMAQADAELHAELLPFALCEELGPALLEARQRADRYRSARAACDEAGKSLIEATSAHKSMVQSLEEAQRIALASRQEAEARHLALTTAEHQVATCLEGADPEPLHTALKDAVDSREQALQQVRLRSQNSRDSLAKAQAGFDETTRMLARENQDLNEAESQLGALMEPHGDEATLAAKALPETVGLELTRQRRSLDDTLRDATAKRRTLEEQQTQHKERRPEGLDPAAGRAPLEVQQTESEEAAQRNLEVAAQTRAVLSAQNEARATKAQAVEKLADARAELSLWSRMNQLIGIREGESFRKFAQVLNLRELLDKANARLSRLRPRYHLVPAKDEQGMDRLAFAVEDAAHAGQVRPVGTLSGGETFLISLSLALALADYRTVRMPIETLLLDEGFGTLDSATLADVLGALTSLTSQGTQVGLISHVEALQEKIPARILVEPVAEGRSRIRVASGPA